MTLRFTVTVVQVRKWIKEERCSVTQALSLILLSIPWITLNNGNLTYLVFSIYGNNTSMKVKYVLET